MRLFRLLPLMLFLLLCGCQGGDSAAGSLPDLDKAQEVRVIPAGETAPTQVLTEKSQIEALILAMDLDHWSTADLPQGLRPAGTLSFTQQMCIRDRAFIRAYLNCMPKAVQNC